MKKYIIDFEFLHAPGELPRPWCVAWWCVETRESGTLWLEGGDLKSPFPEEFVMIAHYAMAELSCFRVLGWDLPTEVIDTLAEARVVRGQVKPSGGGWGQLSVACQYGVKTMSGEHKDEMRTIAMQEAIPEEKRDSLMDYCLDDVKTCLQIWEAIESQVCILEAQLRGRYLKALSKVEARGIPADVALVKLLLDRSSDIVEFIWLQARDLYPGVISEKGTFKSKGWKEWCKEQRIPWPSLPSGAPALDADTFKKMTDRYPEARVMAYAKKMRGQTRRFKFPVGGDGRLRCMLSPFASDTGRNQPSNSQFVFGASAWIRSIIQAPEGLVLAYVDFSAQEPALAGSLSGDESMMEDYRSGDPYMAFAVRAGAVPENATKGSHPDERATYKIATLAVQYGMQAESLSKNLGVPVSEARRLIDQHKASYPTFWTWRQAVVDTVTSGGEVSTKYGWTRKLRPKDSGTSVANFPIQSAGAEILRISIIALEESGHRVIAPVHDAVLVEMDEDGWQDELKEIRKLMAKAAASVAPDIEIPTDVELIFPGDNYIDKRGGEFWKLVSPVIGRGPQKRADGDHELST